MVLTVLVLIGAKLAANGILSKISDGDTTKKVIVIVMVSALSTALCLYPLFYNLYKDIHKFADDVVTGNIDLAKSLGNAIALRDSDTGSHNFRVTLYAFYLAEAIDNPNIDMRALLLGAFLHDIGKIGIHDDVLLKPGKLTDTEMLSMQNHVTLGLDIIGSSRWLQLAKRVIENHHERFDGRGYPNGIKGNNIPIEARIFSIVDVFDALTSKRPYKDAMDPTEALNCMAIENGKHFDSTFFNIFSNIALNMHRKFYYLTELELENKMTNIVNKHKTFLYSNKPISPVEMKF